MSDRLLIIFSVSSAMMFAIAYRPMLIRMSLGLNSPYSKADITKRIFAATMDCLLVVTLLVAYRSSKSLVYLASAAAYLLMHDAIMGRSAGKFLCGLVVIDLETGLPCGWKQSVSRNFLFLLPGANAVAAFLEVKTCIQDPQGERLGDRIALTQVVEGFGVKDLVGALQKWWRNFSAVLDWSSPQPDRVPVRIPR